MIHSESPDLVRAKGHVYCAFLFRLSIYALSFGVKYGEVNSLERSAMRLGKTGFGAVVTQVSGIRRIPGVRYWEELGK